MRKLLFIFILFSCSLQAQTLTKVVNGTTVELTKEEANTLKSQWASNDSISRLDSIQSVANLQTLNSIIGVAQASVGTNVVALTTNQVRALICILLWKEGAIDNNLRIKMLNTWAK